MVLCLATRTIIFTLLSVTFVRSFLAAYPQCLNIHHRHKLLKYHGLYSKNFISELWEEIVEFSTYGPSERRMLKAKREAAAQSSNQNSILDENDSDETWKSAFKNAALKTKKETGNHEATTPDDLDYDGYTLRDLIVNKWGVPLDVDFQRIPGLSIYCTILPFVGYDSTRSRHNSELDYLMHLQGVVEILHKYNNLDTFVAFIETTNKIPRPGTDSVPYRLSLTDEQLSQIAPKT